ncbi:MAG: phenylalanine--tRNA ligase subunit beta-related protein [Minisyncoccota bacterium]
MKVTRETLQKYFEAPLPSIGEIADAFTFHAFEIESIEGDVLDIKVLPNRVADCGTAEGIAHELAAILDMPLKAATEPDYSGSPTVAVTVAGVNAILGADFSSGEVLDVFRRLQFRVETSGDAFRVSAPAPRTDIATLEDVAEEIGQILGYDRIPSLQLPMSNMSDQARFRGIERVKDFLVERGFTEISTQSFAKKGDIVLANPLDKSMPALRTSLDDNMLSALAQAKRYAPLVLAPGQKPKLFEIGTVFAKDGERLVIKTSEPVADMPGIEDAPDYVPERYELGAYKPFSLYPFVTRDIALWAGGEAAGAEQSEVRVERIIREHAGELLARLDQFDRFEKEGRVSYAFRLVFQSMERTLTDDEVNAIMEDVSAALRTADFEVR